MSHDTANLRQIFLRPGELFLCCEPSLITTLLGSCVAVTMFNPRLQQAAICHALLPRPGAREAEGKGCAEPYKYVSLVIPAMLEFFRVRGIALPEIEVKMFGGANVLRRSPETGSEWNIGHGNIRSARALLEASNMRIKRAHVGGVVGRKLIFNTATGEVLLKQLTRNTVSPASTE